MTASSTSPAMPPTSSIVSPASKVSDGPCSPAARFGRLPRMGPRISAARYGHIAGAHLQCAAQREGLRRGRARHRSTAGGGAGKAGDGVVHDRGVARRHLGDLGQRVLPHLEEYVFALADVMRREYEAIVAAGFVLQIDCPDLAIAAQPVRRSSRRQFSEVIGIHVDALNHATAIGPIACACTSAGATTRARTTMMSPLGEIIAIVLRRAPAALSFEGANPRHEHEWKVWRDIELPDGKIIIPGRGRHRRPTTSSIPNSWPSASSATQRSSAKSASSPGPTAASAACSNPAASKPASCGPSSAALVEGARLASTDLW